MAASGGGAVVRREAFHEIYNPVREQLIEAQDVFTAKGIDIKRFLPERFEDSVCKNIVSKGAVNAYVSDKIHLLERSAFGLQISEDQESLHDMAAHLIEACRLSIAIEKECRDIAAPREITEKAFRSLIDGDVLDALLRLRAIKDPEEKQVCTRIVLVCLAKMGNTVWFDRAMSLPLPAEKDVLYAIAAEAATLGCAFDAADYFLSKITDEEFRRFSEKQVGAAQFKLVLAELDKFIQEHALDLLLVTILLGYAANLLLRGAKGEDY